METLDRLELLGAEALKCCDSGLEMRLRNCKSLLALSFDQVGIISLQLDLISLLVDQLALCLDHLRLPLKPLHRCINLLFLGLKHRLKLFQLDLHIVDHDLCFFELGDALLVLAHLHLDCFVLAVQQLLEYLEHVGKHQGRDVDMLSLGRLELLG